MTRINDEWTKMTDMQCMIKIMYILTQEFDEISLRKMMMTQFV